MWLLIVQRSLVSVVVDLCVPEYWFILIPYRQLTLKLYVCSICLQLKINIFTGYNGKDGIDDAIERAGLVRSITLYACILL